jgi:hypothetical protein
VYPKHSVKAPAIWLIALSSVAAVSAIVFAASIGSIQGVPPAIDLSVGQSPYAFIAGLLLLVIGAVALRRRGAAPAATDREPG